MTSTINLFMKKELTCLPAVFNKYVSKYYNNALGNSLTWAFFIWLFLHVAFDKFMNAILRQMKYPEYFRQRVISTLWSFGFSFSSFIYCVVVLSNQNFSMSDLQMSNQFLKDRSTEIMPGQYILGFVILSSYYAQSALWEGSRNGCNQIAVNYLLILILSVYTFMRGWCELLFSLVTLSSLTQCALEMSKIFSFQIHNRKIMMFISQVWFGFHFALCFGLYFIILPLQFLIPCGRNFKSEINFSILFLNVVLWCWFLFSIFESVLFKMIKHYVYHMNENDTECKLGFLECCMFPRRTDTAYGIALVKKEIERRREFMHLQRKKPNKVALYQTLKCMVTVKRKLKQRRAAHEVGSGSSSSSEDNSPTPSEAMDLYAGTAIVHEIVDDLLHNIDKECVNKEVFDREIFDKQSFGKNCFEKEGFEKGNILKACDEKHDFFKDEINEKK